MTLYIIIAAVAVLLVVNIFIFNRLVKARNIVNEAYSGIDVQLQKRFELIPNLVQTVKAYNKHEAETLQKVVENRQAKGTTVQDTAKEDKAVTTELNRFKIHVEDYPQLKADGQFIQLMTELSKVEDELAMSRRYYNGTVREFNTQLQVFPNNITAPLFGFKERTFYDFEGDPNAPDLELNTQS